MLKAVAIDDEVIALERFKRIAEQDSNISLLGCFTKSLEAMKFIRENDIDVVFLDIEMPKVNGLELSEQIFEIKPEIDVVFVTAYDKYALQAIQANAMGYLLKPMEFEDIKQQTDKLIRKRLARKKDKVNGKLKVQFMGEFRCFWGETEQIRWRTAKAEELFAFLIHCQGKPVSKDKIIGALWPNMDTVKTDNNLYVTCHYIRDVLKENGFSDVFIRTRGCYQIRMDKLQCDLMDVLKIIDEASITVTSIDILEELSKLYKGVYLDDKSYDWANNMRVWLEGEYEKLQYRLVNIYIERGKIDSAIDVLKNLILNIQLSDEAYKLLIELFIENKDYISAKHYYIKYEKILQDEIGVLPPEEIIQLMKF